MNKQIRHTFCTIAVAAVIALTAGAAAPVGAAQEGGVAASSAAGAEAVVVTPAAPVPGGPNFFSQISLAFHGWPRENVPTGYNGITLYNPDTSSHAYEAMVSLPHGAVITKFVVWAYDNNASQDLWAVIARAGADGSGVSQIARVDSSEAVAAVRTFEDTTILTPNVDLQNYVYWVEVFLPPGSATGIVSFRIDYGYPAYLPMLTRK